MESGELDDINNLLEEKPVEENTVEDNPEKKSPAEEEPDILDPTKEVDMFVGLLSELKEMDVNEVRELAKVSSKLCAVGKKLTKAERIKHYSVSTQV